MNSQSYEKAALRAFPLRSHRERKEVSGYAVARLGCKLLPFGGVCKVIHKRAESNVFL
jgi:hypothetical protein